MPLSTLFFVHCQVSYSSVKSRFIGVNITNLQQIVSVFELYRKLLGDNAPVRDRHRPFSFLSVIRFSFECFPDCDIRDFLRLIAFLNILDGVETVLLNISESRKQDGTAAPGRLCPLGRWGINQHDELAVVEQAQRAEQLTADRDRFHSI